MKTESTVKPEKLNINLYDKFEKCIINFNTNIHEEERTISDEHTQIYYIYDTYTIQTWYRDTLKQDILDDYDNWLNYAKQQEYDEYAKNIREKRDKLLQESDKEMVLDRLKINMPEEINIANIVDNMKKFFTSFKKIFNSDMAIYRQALRDIPQQEGFPYDVFFPIKPEV